MIHTVIIIAFALDANFVQLYFLIRWLINQFNFINGSLKQLYLDESHANYTSLLWSIFTWIDKFSLCKCNFY